MATRSSNPRSSNPRSSNPRTPDAGQPETSRGDVLRLDIIRCDGHGICADLLPEMIRLDDWGYPMLGDGPIPRELMSRARWAVSNCPVLALRIEKGRSR